MGFKVGGTTIINSSGEISADVGNIDGRDIAVDGAKLDTIATNADVTSSALTALTTETSLTGSDIIPIYDTANSTWKKATITNAALQGPSGPTGPSGSASTSHNSVGSYAMLKRTSYPSGAGWGSTYGGSGLRAAGFHSRRTTHGPNLLYHNGPTVSGTWRSMGSVASWNSDWLPTTVFVRIS
jgi:hypothetical protein